MLENREDREIGEKLRSLTVTEVEVLYWKCKGRTYIQIEQIMPYGKDWVQLRMSNVYAKLGFKKEMHHSQRKIILEERFCPVLQKGIQNIVRVKNLREDTEAFQFWPPDPPEPKPDPVGLILVKQEYEIEKTIIIDNGQQPLKPPPQLPPQPPPRPRRWPYIVIALIIVAGVSYYLGTRSGDDETVPVVVEESPIPEEQIILPVPTSPPIETEAVEVIPSDTPLPTDTIVPTDTPISDEQIPPPGTTIPFEDSFSKSGITVWLNDFEYNEFKEITFRINIRNERSNDYLLRFRPNVFSVTDNLGKTYKLWSSIGMSLDKLEIKTISPGASIYIDLETTHWKFIGEIDPSVTQIFVHASELAGMQDLHWVYSLE